jgi:hypothetical protein
MSDTDAEQARWPTTGFRLYPPEKLIEMGRCPECSFHPPTQGHRDGCTATDRFPDICQCRPREGHICQNCLTAGQQPKKEKEMNEPSIAIDECNELATALQNVIRLEDDFEDACKRLPGIEEMHQLIAAMSTIISLAEQMPDFSR